MCVILSLGLKVKLDRSTCRFSLSDCSITGGLKDCAFLLEGRFLSTIGVLWHGSVRGDAGRSVFNLSSAAFSERSVFIAFNRLVLSFLEIFCTTELQSSSACFSHAEPSPGSEPLLLGNTLGHVVLAVRYCVEERMGDAGNAEFPSAGLVKL